MFKTDLPANCVVLGAVVFNMVTGDHLLILDKGNEFVTCHYRAGDTEWGWGHYYADIKDAWQDFAIRLERDVV